MGARVTKGCGAHQGDPRSERRSGRKRGAHSGKHRCCLSVVCAFSSSVSLFGSHQNLQDKATNSEDRDYWKQQNNFLQAQIEIFTTIMNTVAEERKILAEKIGRAHV